MTWDRSLGSKCTKQGMAVFMVRMLNIRWANGRSQVRVASANPGSTWVRHRNLGRTLKRRYRWGLGSNGH